MSEETSDLRVFSPDVDESRVVSVTVGELQRLANGCACDGSVLASIDEVTVRERTCHNFANDDEFTCSTCGCRFEIWDELGYSSLYKGGDAAHLAFCPSCGARVVDG